MRPLDLPAVPSPRDLRRAVEVLRAEGAHGLGRRLRRRLAGGQAQVFDDYRRWLLGAGSSSPTTSAGALDLTVSVVTPVCDPPPGALRALVDSLRAQEHTSWQLCLADDASRDPRVQRELAAACAADDRVRLVRAVTRRGIAGATRLALSLATGDLVAFVDHDDLLPPDALRRVARAFAAAPDAGVLFSDEDKLDARGRHAPFFKPAFDPTLLLRVNYAAHLLVARHDLVRAAGGPRSEFDGAQDHDLVLRLTEAAGRVLHVPRVLYHWRVHPGSTAGSPAAKAHAAEAGRRAVAEALRRRGLEGRVEHGAWTGSYRVRLAPRVDPREVSVVLDAPATPSWLAALPVGEVLAGAGGRTALRAAVAARARGRYLLFVGPVAPRGDARAALAALLGEAGAPGVGFVAPTLLAGGRVAEQGLALGHGADATVGALEPGAGDGDLGYFGLLTLPRTVAAASGLALLVERAALEAAGGLDAVAFPDAAAAGVDLCLRGARAGLRTVVTPEARFDLAPQAWARHDLCLGAARAALRSRLARAPDDPFSSPCFARGAARLRLRDAPPDAPARAVDARTGAWWPRGATPGTCAP